MKTKAFALLFCLVALFLSEKPAMSQSKYCQNLSFELGNFTNWVGYDWIYKTDNNDNVLYPPTTSPTLSDLTNPGRQKIMTDTSARDPKIGGQLRTIPKGYRYSARLGNWDTQCHFQSLSYTMTVDSFNALLMVKFAVVLQNPGHPIEQEPRFKFTIYDQNHNPFSACTDYDVYSLQANDFQDFSGGKWRDWTAVGINLLSHIGQTVTVEFQTQDCTLGAHFGYAYFVAECRSMVVSSSYCRGDTVAVLKAPEGFQKYAWTDANGNLLETTSELRIPNPVNGSVYSCTLNSFTGCVITLQSQIIKNDYTIDFSSSMVDCKTNKVNIINNSSKDKGYLNFNWDFGDGNSSTERDPQYNFATSGRHNVTLMAGRPNSTCIDTVRKVVESFSPPLVGITGDTTYCPGLSTNLHAYGAWNYSWSNNLTTDSIEVKPPGGKFWLIGYSSTGCFSDTIFRTITQEPDWAFINKSDTMLCLGGQAKLCVTGANKYQWNTAAKDTTSSVTVSKAGTYVVEGYNKRGCEKTKDIHVREVRFNEDFYSKMLDCRSNKVQIVNTSPADSGYIYKWDFGDGAIKTDTAPQYTFSTSGRHKVMLVVGKPPSMCVDTLFKTIESFSPPLVGFKGDTAFCPGFSVTLKAYGAWIYDWSSKSNADSITVSSPGGRYWLVGHSSTGCSSDTIYKNVLEEPYWAFSNQSDSALCIGGDKAVLSVLGAKKYIWDPTKEVTPSIVVTSPGRYVVTGTSLLGCKKTITVNVKEYPLPEFDIKTSTLLLNPRNTTLLSSVIPEEGVTYNWDMGDGTTAQGIEVDHTYDLSSTINSYTVSLTATDTLGCIKSKSVLVEVSDGIFIPNVFTPNGDGINDLFMPDADLQIMDRNGLVLYKGTSGWDGTYNGRVMTPDTYFYLMHYNDRGGKERTRKGFITLVR
jgi:gliding motility-associated-like protein